MEDEKTERKSVGMATAGRNPHYKPAINRWRTVEVRVPDGCMAGVILDSELSGALCIVIHPGTEWPDNVQLERGHVARLLTAERPWFVCRNEERGPAVGHELEADPQDPARCLICDGS